MTSLPPQNFAAHDMPLDDPLVALWQTASQPDTHNLVEEIRRSNRLHKTFYRSLLAILCGFALLLIFEEATGRLATRGLLSAAWIVFVTGAVWRDRARCSRLDAMTLDTVTLLKRMISRAQNDLKLARYLYAGTPVGAVVGIIGMKLLMKFAGVGTRTVSSVNHPHLEMLQTAAGLAAIVVMVVAGLVLARSRARLVKELSEKLTSIESEL